MSLESGNWIKDLIESNPEGTDPKSQGDDHLRLIKHILKTQFSGLTQGKAITGTEDNFNSFMGNAGARPLGNIDAGALQFSIFGVVAGSTGALPPGWLAGDIVLDFPWDINRQFQIYLGYASNRIWYRVYNVPTWSAWFPLKGLGSGQQWGDFTGPRAFGVQYINDANQTIQVSVVAQSNSTTFTYMVGFVRGQIVARVPINDGASGVYGTCQLIVPPLHEYQINLLGGSVATIVNWMELR